MNTSSCADSVLIDARDELMSRARALGLIGPNLHIRIRTIIRDDLPNAPWPENVLDLSNAARSRIMCMDSDYLKMQLSFLEELGAAGNKRLDEMKACFLEAAEISKEFVEVIKSAPTTGVTP